MTISEKRCLSCGAGMEHDTLACAYCGTSHVVTSSGLACACGKCGAGNPPSAKSCVQCRAALGHACPECKTFNPLGARFCQECTIEFRAYQRADLRVAPNQVALDEVEGVLLDWLDSRWFKARDLREHLRVLEKTLVWVPRWYFQCSARGSVQGQVSQTHYRPTTVRRPDGDGKWVDSVSSEAYTVWEHVTKEFDEALALSRPASAAAEGFNSFLGNRAPASQPVRGELGGEPYERVFEPDQEDVRVFRALRARAHTRLKRELLERVERLDARFFGPALSLVFTPVWQVVYRYKGAHGDARIHGVTRRVEGKKISLFTQWFS